MTGIASGNVLSLNLEEAASVVKKENARVAGIIGINKAARCTTVKPSGSTSCVLGTSSGIHAWHDNYYLRRVRFNKSESIYSYLKSVNPSMVEDEFGNEGMGAVVSIPQKSPDGAILRTESTIEMLKRVEKFNLEWVHRGHRTGDNTHNVSATAYIKEEDWEEVGDWMWSRRANYNGLSVLPYDGGVYKQTPFESISKEQYEALVGAINPIDLTKVREDNDYTSFAAETACSGGGACELV